MQKVRNSEDSGIQFGRYRLLEDIGSGGMAVVSRAVVDGPRGFAREIVIKRILREFSSYPSFVRMLATEARLSAMLRHPGIVQVHEFGEVEGEYYLAMELVDGSDLRDVQQLCVQRAVRPPVGVVAFIISEIASALSYAHGLVDEDERPLDIVHRDISPSNIMVTPVGTVKLLDFGIAHAEDHIREDQTRTTFGSLKGKLSYLSPEQADGRPVDGRSDLFALGIVFHELLTTKRLFRGQSELDTMRLIREAEVTPPSALVEGIPEDVDAVVMKLLAKAPADRFQNGDEVVSALTPIVRRMAGDSAALRRFLRDLGPIGSRSTGAPTPGNGQSGGSRSNPRERSNPQSQSRSRSRSSSLAGSYGEAKAVTRVPLSGILRGSRTAWIGITAAVVAVAALLGSTSFHHSDPAPPLHASLPVQPPAAAPAPVQPQDPVLPPPSGITTAPASTAQATTATAPPAAPAPQAVTPPPPAPAPVAVSPPAAAAPSTDRVRLSVTGTEGAEVIVDGILVGTVPLQISLPQIGTIRHVVVRRSGYKRWVADVDGKQDAALVAPLTATATASKPRSSSSGGSKDAAPLYLNPFK